MAENIKPASAAIHRIFNPGPFVDIVGLNPEESGGIEGIQCGEGSEVGWPESETYTIRFPESSKTAGGRATRGAYYDFHAMSLSFHA